MSELSAKSGTLEPPRVKSISSLASRRAGARVSLAVFFFFFVLGAIIFYFFGVRPMLGVLAARNWKLVPCTIISSRVQSHQGDDGTTYRVEIVYEYEFNGHQYRSTRYHFMGGSTSGYQRKAEVVRQNPPGAKRTCYVNPRKPEDAVLERGLTAEMWFGLIPAAFMVAGAGGIIGSLRKRQAGGSDASRLEPVSIREITGTSMTPAFASTISDDAIGPRVLRGSSSRPVGAIVIAVFAAIWNGVIYFAFFRNLFRHGHSTWFDWAQLLFMVPFVLVGLGLIGLLIYQLLALFNPKAELSIQPGAPALGDPLEVSWQLAGRTHVLRGLRIFLEAREEATYRRGTSTYTDRKPFLNIEVASATGATGLSAGRTSVRVPADTVPSFKSDNNRIVWVIAVHGDIPRWPDLKEEFEIKVRPQPGAIPA
jgi:hypothetical protein